METYDDEFGQITAAFVRVDLDARGNNQMKSEEVNFVGIAQLLSSDQLPPNNEHNCQRNIT